MNNKEKVIFLLNNFAIDEEKIYKRLIPNIQEMIVDQLWPDEKDLIRWKTSSKGRYEFRDYMNSKCNKKFSEVHLDALWRYYTRNVNIYRSKIVVNLFKQLNEGNEKCAHCFECKNLQVDHKIPLVKGGLDVIENLQFLCRDCNLEKHGRYDYKELII